MVIGGLHLRQEGTMVKRLLILENGMIFEGKLLGRIFS
ncbi:Carbamoyl-phosphate synthase small chain [Streptococcus gordonii]|uniref:Carbamoyl-phosphate synthase small chain n=1 Tax=Streptococcus gordonii TaxID=1302 RepID=A0A139NAY8_STRGN|nr:Carbamoyl-phosphate synthase small chain [Streptococcus gordonii]